MQDVDQDYLPKLDEEQKYDSTHESTSLNQDQVRSDESIKVSQNTESSQNYDEQSKDQQILHKTHTKNIPTEMFI